MERSEPTLAAGFRSVAVITFALHAKGPQFETGRKQRVAFCVQTGFRSVVVIMFASHAKGPQFETGRKQMCLFPRLLKSGSVAFLGNATKPSPA